MKPYRIPLAGLYVDKRKEAAYFVFEHQIENLILLNLLDQDLFLLDLSLLTNPDYWVFSFENKRIDLYDFIFEDLFYNLNINFQDSSWTFENLQEDLYNQFLDSFICYINTDGNFISKEQFADYFEQNMYIKVSINTVFALSYLRSYLYNWLMHTPETITLHFIDINDSTIGTISYLYYDLLFKDLINKFISIKDFSHKTNRKFR